MLRNSLGPLDLDIKIRLPAIITWKDTQSENDIQHPSHVTEINGIIHRIEQGVTEIDKYAKQAQHMLDQLGMRRKELETLAFEHRSLIAPIRSLPNELLSEIFEWSCDLSPWDHNFPVSLLLVCRDWQAVALSTPTIWANIIFGEYFQSDSSIKNGSANQAVSWLRRAANKPLSLKFPEPLEVDTKIPKELISACERWEHLHCSLDCQSPSIFSPIKGHLPLLKALVLITDSTIHLPDLNLFEIAPRLRDVLLFRPRADAMLKLPFSQLTKLSITQLLPSELWLEYLRLCPNLTVFEAHLDSDQEATSVTLGPHLTHKCIRLLKLCGHMEFQPYLNEVTLPALQTLEVSNVDDSSSKTSLSQTEANVENLFNMISRSSCTITAFCFSFQHKQNPIIDHLNLFSELRHLAISVHVKYVPTFLSTLTSQGLCPRLETLDLFLDGTLPLEDTNYWFESSTGQGGDHLDGSILIAFLQARNAKTQFLKRVRIADKFFSSFKQLCGHPEPPDLQALRDKGLSVLFGSREVLYNRQNGDTVGQPHTYES